MVQYGFFFDQGRCSNCKACSVACRDWYDLPPGPVKWLRMFEWEKGSWPNPTVNYLFAPCYHCENPVCVDACPVGARYKEDKYGAVLVDETKCVGKRQCWVACPYGAPQYADDAMGTRNSACVMCIDRLEQGLVPECVAACPTRALDFGPLADLQKKYGTTRDLPDMPDSSIAKPAVVFKPKPAVKQVVPYDANKALAAWQKRGYNPGVFFNSTADVTEVPPGMIKRTKLNMKPAGTEEVKESTRSDEG